MKREALAIGLLFLSCAAPAVAQDHTLRGSREKMERQHGAADSSGYAFLQTPADVRQYADLGVLVPVDGNDDLQLKKVSFAVTRPEVRLFVERLAAQYHDACGQPLVVTSLTRPLDEQPDNASELSVHPAGMAVDIGRAPKRSCRRWIERKLLALQDDGVLEATKERHPAHYHVAVYPQKYLALVDAQGDEAPVKLAAAAAAAPEPRQERVRAHRPVRVSAARLPAHRAVYRVQRGDTLGEIAQRHGVSVAVLKRANRLHTSRISAGQVLHIPVTG